MTVLVTQLLVGSPELCPTCGGRGDVCDGMHDTCRCPTCKGARTVVRAVVSGEMIVPVTAKVGDAVG